MKRLFMLMLVALCVASLLLGCVPGTPEDPTEPTAAPTDPAPTDPAPTDPAPTDPAPTDPPHTHTPADDDGDCTTDILCTECGEVATPGAEAHTPNADDGDCTTAITCSVCGKETTAAAEAHIPNADDGDCTTAITCSVCGKETTPAKNHTPNADDGDCTTAITCSVCGKETTAAKNHTPGEDDGDCLTAVNCTVCGKVATAGAEAHDFGLNNAKCANCDAQNPNYVAELAIPENSKLLADFSSVVNPHIPSTWGSGEAGAYYNSYGAYEGRGGVFAMGANGECFMWYNAIGLNDMDLTGMDTITFRIKVKNSIRALQIKHDEIDEFDLLGRIPVRDEWTEVTIKVADLGYSDLSKATIQFRFATWNEGETEYVWIDQVYASAKRDVEELPIPEGSVMLNDYSSWGTPDKGYYNFYEQYEGKAGVFAMGATNGDSAMWYGNSVIEGVDLSEYESMTIRMKASDCLWSLYLTQNNQIDYVLYDKIPAFNEWFEITIKIADFGFPDVTNAYLQFQFRTGNSGNRECVWVDQIYLTPKAVASVEELAIPEGATMIADFSQPVAPHNPDSWGSGPAAAYYNSYAEYAGRAGVFAMGSNSEAFMWYSLSELNEMDLSGYETITFRMMVKSSIRSLNFTQHNTNDYDLKSRIPVYDEWFDLTINIADLNFGDSITSAILQFQFATWNEGETEYVWIDQVYAQ